MNEEYLEHHGVKGMRWGIRKKYYAKKAEKAEVKARNARAKADTVGNASHKKIENMTDDELRLLATRIRLENDYERALQDMNQLYKNKHNVKTTTEKIDEVLKHFGRVNTVINTVRNVDSGARTIKKIIDDVANS